MRLAHGRSTMEVRWQGGPLGFAQPVRTPHHHH